MGNFRIIWLAFCAVILLSACKDDEPNGPTPPRVNEANFNITLNPEVAYQNISGFGGANGVFNGSLNLNNEQERKVFSTEDDGLGFSIYRIKLPYNSADWQALVPQAQAALSYGAKVIASPWSPPPALKSNNNAIGGFLLKENYEAYANHLNDYVAFMAENDVEIYGVSIQNEPDIQVSYESCDWTAADIRDFVKNYGDLIQSTRIMAPESFNFNQSYSDVLLNDAEAAANTDIIAGHIYGSGLAQLPLDEQAGKEIWMTEYLMNLGTGNAGAAAWTTYSDEQIWDETMDMLNTVHEAMSFNWNAYIWWYTKRYYSFLGDGTQGTTEGEILKRGVAFSHFSRFIRPGFVRIEASADKESGLDITAYEGEDQIVVVIINSTDSPIADVAFSFEGINITSAGSYNTTVLLDRSFRSLEINDSQVMISVLGRSVTTLVLDK